MKSAKMLAILVLALSLMVCQARVSGAEPMGTAFTYQGRLTEDEIPADGLYDLQFSLFDDPNTEIAYQIGTTIDIDDLDVIDGYFTVVLDFGSDVFDGYARWLEITVAQSDGSEPFALTPPVELTPTPYALQTRGIFVDGAENVGIGTTTPEAKLDVEVTSGPAATIGSSLNSAIGGHAVALGYTTTAGGGVSTAMGANTTAGGYASTAMGHYTTADGFASTAMGRDTTAGGNYSTAMGLNTTASGLSSTAMGRGIEAAGQYSVAIALTDMEGTQVTQNNTMAIMGGKVGIGT